MKKLKIVTICLLVISFLEIVRSIIFRIQLFSSPVTASFPNYDSSDVGLFIVVCVTICITNKNFKSGQDLQRSLLSVSPIWMRLAIFFTQIYCVIFYPIEIFAAFSSDLEYERYWELRSMSVGNIFFYTQVFWFLYTSLKRMNTSSVG